MAKKIGDKSCQSNFDIRASDFSSFLSYLNNTVKTTKRLKTQKSKQKKKGKIKSAHSCVLV